MDYVDDACMDQFSPKQIDRIKVQVGIFRSTLIDKEVLKKVKFKALTLE